MLARSEPASGSVMAMAAIASPVIAGARNRRFCSSVPKRATGGVAISVCTATAMPRPPQCARHLFRQDHGREIVAPLTAILGRITQTKEAQLSEPLHHRVG